MINILCQGNARIYSIYSRLGTNIPVKKESIYLLKHSMTMFCNKILNWKNNIRNEEKKITNCIIRLHVVHNMCD